MNAYLAASSIITIALTGCMLGPDFAVPDVSVGRTWKQKTGIKRTSLPDAWWTHFGDGELNRLVNRALAANEDLAAAKSRVDTARALVGANRAKLFPTLDLASRSGITRSSAEAARVNLPSGADIDLELQRYLGSFDLAYDPDLWGRNKRTIEASSARFSAEEARLDLQRLGIATEVTRQYFLLRGLDAQHAILQDTLKSHQESLGIQTSKSDAGLSDGLSTSRDRAEVKLAENDLAIVSRQRGAAENALAVLCGTAPSEFGIQRQVSSRPLPSIDPGLPAEVLNRRPDVRAALQDLRAANAEIGVAEAAFYPNFSLTASGGFESIDVASFLDWQNRVLSLGANVAAPIFDGGSNRANHQAALSRYQEALANYRQTLLVALREVEDSLVDLKSLANSRSSLELALTSTREILQLSRDRFDKGLTSYFEVVDAERSALQIQLSLSQVDAEQRITLAALAKSLGGGWNTRIK